MRPELWSNKPVFVRRRYPRRDGFYWNDAEREDVATAYNAGTSIEEIARNHERGADEIRWQLEYIADRVARKLTE